MYKRLLIFAFCAGLISACNSSSKTSRQIDYAKLDSLKKSMVLEIGESENFLPARLRDVVVTSGGDILVSDMGSVTITQFDNQGNFVATIAKKGDGPGELSNFFSMQNLGDDTLMVGFQTNQKAFFAKDGNGIFQFIRATVPQGYPKRPLTLLSHQTDTTYYARAGLLVNNIKDAVKNSGHYQRLALVITDKEGEIIKDSLSLLKNGMPQITETSNRGININTIPYRYDDHFVPLDNGGYIIARPDSSAFYFYDRDQKLQRKISLNIKPRPVTQKDLNYALRDTKGKLRSAMESHIGGEKPPFLDVWATNNHIWLHTDNSKEGKQMVVLSFDGKPLGKFMLPGVDEIQQIRENTIYTIHRSPDKGNQVRVYNIVI